MINNRRPTEQQLNQAYRKALSAYGERENVTGVDIGYRYRNGKRTNEMAVRVHVKEKLPSSALEAAEILPEEINGVPIDVVEAVYRPQVAPGLEPAGTRKDRLNPIQPGISVSHPNVTAGTFGALVYDRSTGRPCILSNWHVLAGSSEAHPGNPILQPGRFDGGRAPRDVVGYLERMMLDNDGDAALAILNNEREVIPQLFGSDIIIEQTRPPQVGDIVKKSGRTTSVTRGRVDGTGRYFIDYSVGRVGIDGFKIVPVEQGNPNNDEISSGGDSGAVWYGAEDRQGLGLHFAGETDSNPQSENALACYLDRVLSRLDVSLSRSQSQPLLQDSTFRLFSYDGTESDVRLLISTVDRLTRLLEQSRLTPPVFN